MKRWLRARFRRVQALVLYTVEPYNRTPPPVAWRNTGEIDEGFPWDQGIFDREPRP